MKVAFIVSCKLHIFDHPFEVIEGIFANLHTKNIYMSISLRLLDHSINHVESYILDLFFGNERQILLEHRFREGIDYGSSKKTELVPHIVS